MKNITMSQDLSVNPNIERLSTLKKKTSKLNSDFIKLCEELPSSIEKHRLVNEVSEIFIRIRDIINEAIDAERDNN